MIIKFDDFVNEELLGSGNRTELTDEDIAKELRELFMDGKYDKDGTMEEKIEELLELYHSWDEKEKQSYNAKELSRKLLQYV